jgi:excisionase family DNA binding protein
MAEMEDRWLSVNEIGKYRGVSSDTVYRWIDKHSMPTHRLGASLEVQEGRSRRLGESRWRCRAY